MYICMHMHIYYIYYIYTYVCIYICIYKIYIETVLMSLGDRSFSRVFLSFFGFYSKNQFFPRIALAIIEYFPYLFVQ